MASQSLAIWETENKMVCKQTLVDGDGPKTYWTRELRGDELILVRTTIVVIVVVNTTNSSSSNSSIASQKPELGR